MSRSAARPQVRTAWDDSAAHGPASPLRLGDKPRSICVGPRSVPLRSASAGTHSLGRFRRALAGLTAAAWGQAALRLLKTKIPDDRSTCNHRRLASSPAAKIAEDESWKTVRLGAHPARNSERAWTGVCSATVRFTGFPLERILASANQEPCGFPRTSSLVRREKAEPDCGASSRCVWNDR